MLTLIVLLMLSKKIITGMLIAAAPLVMSGMPDQAREFPNILWISVEDIGPVLGCYGVEGIQTPNIDRLANEGIRYNHAYATVGVCAPSRSSIITGMYPVSIGTHQMRTGPHYAARSPENETYQSYYGLYDTKGRNVPEYAAVPPPYVRCFTEYLREAGYYTTNNAKTDYQFNSPITAWDEVGRQADHANRLEGRPFFSVYNHEITHESRIWMKWDEPLLVSPQEVIIPDYFPDLPIVRETLARNYSNIMELDRQVGNLLERLEAEGLLDNTIIFFWSDHGGPLLRQKRAVGNSGLHVPLIVRFPDGYMAGTQNNDIVSLMDLGPTVLSLAGVEPPEYIHGKAFLGPYQATEPHRYAFGSADRFDEVYDMSRSVLDGRFVYIRNFRPELPLIYRLRYREQIEMTRVLIDMDSRGELTGDASYIFMKTKPREELYDLHADPFEVHNLADDPSHREKLLELREALAAWQLEIGDMGFIPEYDLVEMMWPGLIQPETMPVEFVTYPEGLTLVSTTPGASIAYQLGDQVGSDHWELYHTPLNLPAGTLVAARAVRIGYKASEITHY